MAVPPAHDDGSALTAPDRADGRPGRVRLVLTAVLALALVAACVALGLVLWDRRGEADDVQRERERVMAQAEQFVLRIGTFGPELLEGEQMPRFREQVAEVLTPKAVTEFEAQVVVAEQLVAQQQAERTAEAFGSGVSDLDDDSATALVAGAFTNTVGGEAGAPFPVYLKLEMLKVDGTWLVDDFGSAVQADDEGALPGGTPSAPTEPQPSTEPSGGATP